MELYCSNGQTKAIEPIGAITTHKSNQYEDSHLLCNAAGSNQFLCIETIFFMLEHV